MHDATHVLITGGSSGIGLAMAELFLEAGHEVTICGRRAERLEAAQAKLPRLRTLRCDISSQDERERLFAEVTAHGDGPRILINNAGIQRETDFRTGAPELTDGESEIETNFTASVHLAALFTPCFLQTKAPCAIINVTSGLAFVPLEIVPVYCATKAALHSFSMSLRSQLRGTNVRVVEVIPPLVKTELHRGEQARRQAERAIPPERVAKAVVRALATGRSEVPVGQGRDLQIASRLAPHFFHRMLNRLVSGRPRPQALP